MDEGTAAVAPRIQVERRAEMVVVALAGEHDVSSRDRLVEAVNGAIDAGLGVIVDLRDAGFVDSVIAAALLDARKAARRRDVTLAVVLSAAPENGVRRMFELSQLTTVFDVYPSVGAAAAAVRSDSGVTPAVTRTSEPRS